MLKRMLLCAGGIGLAATLLGCGSGTPVPPGQAVAFIRHIESSPPWRLSVASVACPRGGSDSGFTCTVRFSSGEVVPFRVRRSSGHLVATPVYLIATAVEKALDIPSGNPIFNGHWDCPRHVPVVVGGGTTCVLDNAQGSATADITITSRDGRFSIGAQDAR